MAQSSYNTYTVNDQYWKAYEENWETKKPYIQNYFDRRSVTYQYQQPMSQYHGDNRKYFGQSSLTQKDNTGRKYISYGYNRNNDSIANGGNLCVPRPRSSQPLAVPRSTSPRSRQSAPRFQPPSTTSQPTSAISRPPSPTCQPPSPRSGLLLPTFRPPTPRPRPPSLRCRPPSPTCQLPSPRSTSLLPTSRPPTPRPLPQSLRCRPPSPTCQPPSPRSTTLLPTSRPPTPRPRPPSLSCRPLLQQSQTMHDPSTFTHHQFQTQYGNQMETHNFPCQRFCYQDDGYWNYPEICYTYTYQIPPSRASGVQPLIEREKNDVNYSGHSPRQTLVNGTKVLSSEYPLQAQINERRQVSTSTFNLTKEHNQNSDEYFQQDGRNKNETSSQLTFPPIEEISQTKYENDKSSITLRTGSWQGQSESRRVIRTRQYRKAPYSAKSIGTPTNIRLRSTGRTSETESNIHLPIYGSVSPLPSNVTTQQNYNSNVATNPISGERSQEQSLQSRGNMHISKSGIVSPPLRAPYLEDESASTVYPAMCPDSHRRVVKQCSTLGGPAGADMRLQYDRGLPGYQIPQQWARPVKKADIWRAEPTHTTSEQNHSDLTNDMRFTCHESNKKYTGLPRTSIGDQNFTNSAKETFASNVTEQYHDSENDISKTAVTDKIPTEITTLSEQSDPACTKAKDWRPNHLQTEETLHLVKGTEAEENANITTGIKDSPKAAESKDGPQNNPAIVALIDRLLKEARTACDLLHQQGQWQQENATGRIRIEKSKGGRPNTSRLLETCGNNSDRQDNRKSFSRSSRRLNPGTGTDQKEIEITKEIHLLMSDLKICGNTLAPAKDPASSGICPPVKKDFDLDKEEEKSKVKTCIKEETKSRAIKAKRRLSSNSLSVTMNTSNGCVDRVVRLISSEDLLSTLSKPKGSMKGDKRVLRQEEEESEGKEDSLVNGAKKAHIVFSELSENTKRAGSSLSEESITRAKTSRHEGEVTRSALIQKEKNIEHDETSKKRKIDENENDIKPTYSCQEHDGPVSSDDILESRKKRAKKEVDENDVPKILCFSQEPMRSFLSKQDSSNKPFLSEDHDSTNNGTKIIESDNETIKLASKDTIPEYDKRKTNDDGDDSGNKAKRSKLEGDGRRSALIQEEKNMKPEGKGKKRKVDEKQNKIKPSYSDQEYKRPVSSEDEDLESPKKRTRTDVDENEVSKSSCFSQELEISLSEQESNKSSFISEDNENVNGTKNFESDNETKKLVLKQCIPEHKERETNDEEEDNEDPNPLSLLQEPERPSSSRQGSGNNFGTLLFATENNADISPITPVWTDEKESGPERVRKSKNMRKTRERQTIVNELKPAKSDSLTELFQLLRI